MATNHVQKGAAMPWTNGTAADVVSGAVIDLGGMVGVAAGNIAIGDTGELLTEEVFTLAKDVVAISQGAALYITPAGLITTATDDGAGVVYTPAGKAFADAIIAAATCQVKLGA